MVIISYDIENNRMRSRFMKMLVKNGAIRLQFSVYEINNTKRVIDNITIKINDYAKHFTPNDSVVIFEVDNNSMKKYGNAIHRDREILYF